MPSGRHAEGYFYLMTSLLSTFIGFGLGGAVFSSSCGYRIRGFKTGIRLAFLPLESVSPLGFEPPLGVILFVVFV